MRSGGRAEAVVRGALLGDPVAQGGVDGVLQGAGSGFDGYHLGPEQVHATDVVRLAHHVLGAHEDDALEPQHGGGRGRGHAVLAGPGLGQEHLFAHVLGEQALAHGVVDLVGSGVVQILTLQPQVEPQLLRQVGAAVERRGPADVIGQQVVQFLLKRFARHDGPHGLFQFQKRRHEELGDELSAEIAVISFLHG